MMKYVHEVGKVFIVTCGKMKRKIAMRIAGVAAPTLTFLPPAVVMLDIKKDI